MLGQLALLQRRLRLRESAMRNINQQIDLIQGEVNESWREIVKLKAELDTLKVQYAQSIVFAYKNRSSYDFLNFIFSATSFNDALRRFEYLENLPGVPRGAGGEYTQYPTAVAGKDRRAESHAGGER